MHRFLNTLVFAPCLFLWQCVAAQYISRSEPSPTYACPTVCQGGTLELKIPQIENFPAGTLIQAWLSNASGSFASGTQTLNAAQYSTNNGGTWLVGPYAFSSNINNLLMRITIPIATPLGSAYTIKMRASNGYVSNDVFQCGGTNFITVTAATTPLAPVLPTASGNGQWLGHVYTWTPTTGAVLNTQALVSAQNFFAPFNYQGHAVYNPLNIDLFFSASGGVPGSSANASSFVCGTAFTTNFSMQLRRTENFAPGLYHLSIQGDDGIRLSIDGGATWILSSFFEQPYASSYKTTQTTFPNGICLSGNTDLLIEYFQRPMDARLTFNVTPAGALPSFTQPEDASVCLPDGASFFITSNAGYTYQWYQSNDGGLSFTELNDNEVFSGATASTLEVLQTNAALDGTLYYCMATSNCGEWSSDTAALLLQNPAVNLSNPLDAVYCNGQALSFSSSSTSNGVSYQWQVSFDGGLTFSNVPEVAPYSGTQSTVLSISIPPAGYESLLFRQSAEVCGSVQYSTAAEIVNGAGALIIQQPSDLELCADETGIISFDATGYTIATWELLQNSGSYLPLSSLAINGIVPDANNNLNIDATLLSESIYVLRCRLSQGCGDDVITQICTLTVSSLVNVLQHPLDVITCEGSSVAFSVLASGSNVVYQWQVSSDGGITFSDLSVSSEYSGQQSAALLINPVNASMNGTLYRCIVSGACNTQTSLVSSLTITEIAQITEQPAALTVCEQQSAVFVCISNVTGNRLWEYSTDGGQTFNPCTGNNWATGGSSDTLTISNAAYEFDGFIFRCAFSFCDSIIFSDTAILNVLALPVLNDLQPPQEVCLSDTVILVLQASNAITYQWQIQIGSQFYNLENSAIFSGVDGPVLTISNLSDSLDLRVFRCEVSGWCGSVKWSNSIALNILTAPTTITINVPDRICSNEQFSLVANFNGSGDAYQWERLDETQNVFVSISDNSVYRGSRSLVLGVNAGEELNGQLIRFSLEVCGDTVWSDPVELRIREDAPVYIPGAFTANGDNLNDVFKIYTDGAPVIYAEVYNLWGERIHVWTTIDEGWDGTYLGNPVQEGVYVYRIWVKTACSEKVYMRTITLSK
jgi:gliding motility-associated-like protein